MAQRRTTRRTTTGAKPAVTKPVTATPPPLTVEAPSSTETPQEPQGASTPPVPPDSPPRADTGPDAVVPPSDTVADAAGGVTPPEPAVGENHPEAQEGTDAAAGPEDAEAAAEIDPVDPNALTEDDMGDIPFRRYWLDYAEKNRINFPDGHILFPNEPLTYRASKIRANTVILTEDVYRMVIPFRSRRATFTLVARSGALVPRAAFVPKDEYRDIVANLLDDIEAEDRSL